MSSAESRVEPDGHIHSDGERVGATQGPAESHLTAAKQTLEMIAGGESLADILTNLCAEIDAQSPVRELQNVIERAVVLSDGETFSIDESWLSGGEPLSGARWRMAAGGASARRRADRRGSSVTHGQDTA